MRKTGPAAKTDAVERLAEPLDLINVMPGHAYRATRAGTAVLHTRPLQRLVRLRQTGLAHLVWPNAENTRLSHSLGTEYWALRLLQSLRSNACAEDVGDGLAPSGNRLRLEQMDTILGKDLSLELLIRLFALTHDMTLLPLSHTLQYQLGFFRSPDAEARRAGRCLDEIRDQIEEIPELGQLSCGSTHREIQDCLRKHLDVVQCIFGLPRVLSGESDEALPEWISPEGFSRWLPVLTFVYDLNHATFSADVIDFVLRDSLAADLPQSFDERLLDHTSIFITQPEGPIAETVRQHSALAESRSLVYRFGLNAVRDRVRHEVLTGAANLYRVRYEIAERVFYHHAKCAADSMLDRALRLIDQHSGQLRGQSGPFAEDRLMHMGDDEFLTLLESEEKRIQDPGNGDSAPSPGSPSLIMQDLLSRQLYQEVYRIWRQSDLPEDRRPLLADSMNPEVRDRVEKEILQGTPGLASTDVTFSCRPPSMQAKPPTMLIGWTDGQPQPLFEIARRDGYGCEALEVHKRYRDLWSLSVYLRPSALSFAEPVRRRCEELFGVPNRAGTGSPPHE